MSDSTKLPTTIFTGFLGSGKTTIISHLIDYLQANGQQVVYIKNEIGSENIDAQIMQGKHIQTRELLNGCICCTLVGPFLSAITEIIETLHPDRLIIEASGVADPSAIALMVASHPNLIRDGVISVIDVVNFEGYKDLSFSAQQQATFTDLILFNKVELVDMDRKRAVVGYVRELNQYAPIIETKAGVINPQLIFGISSKELDDLLTHQTPHQHDHLQEDQLQTITLHHTTSIHQQTLSEFLTHLPKQVFRVKGLVATPDRQSLLVNKVGTRVEFAPYTGQTDNTTHLILIGFQIQGLEPQLQHTFQSLS